MNSSPDDHYWLDMFHRTLFQDDQCAMEQFQQQFNKVVLDWLRLHPKREEVYRYEKEEYFLVQTFACFWQATACHSELKFSHLTAVLRYLQASLNGVIIDTLRTNSYTREVSLSSPDYSKESVATTQENADEVWKNIWSLLTDTREQRLAYLLFHCGLKPGEVTRSYPQEFNDAREISRLRHNIIEQAVLAQE
ncbi:MAG: hypothetical protein NVS9B9_24650 [Ktedonobacteraceae bacterium]